MSVLTMIERYPAALVHGDIYEYWFLFLDAEKTYCFDFLLKLTDRHRCVKQSSKTDAEEGKHAISNSEFLIDQRVG